VEAPGVEARRSTLGFDGLRDGSREEGPDFAGLAMGDENASEVSGGFEKVRCSGVVRVDDGCCGTGSRRETTAEPAGKERVDTDDEVRMFRARMCALEHVLAAVESLLAAGDVKAALAIVIGWRGARR